MMKRFYGLVRKPKGKGGKEEVNENQKLENNLLELTRLARASQEQANRV